MNPNNEDYDFLVDRNEIAHILGVGPTAISNYVSRINPNHPPFPEAVVTRAFGRFRLYHLDDVQSWHERAFPKRTDVWDDAWNRLQKFRGES